MGDVWRRLWEMCKGGCRRCVKEAVGDVWRRLWEMCKEGCGRCVEEGGRCVEKAVEDV